MDFTLAKQEIENWIQDFVEKSNPLLNGWAPCPYARQARIEQKINIRRGQDPYYDITRTYRNGIRDADVVIYVYDPADWPLESFRIWQRAGCFNPHDLYTLEDHPADSEIANGVTMNQGAYAILFVQKKHKLEEAARQLASKGYYNGWPEDYLQELFRDREDPRS